MVVHNPHSSATSHRTKKGSSPKSFAFFGGSFRYSTNPKYRNRPFPSSPDLDGSVTWRRCMGVPQRGVSPNGGCLLLASLSSPTPRMLSKSEGSYLTYLDHLHPQHSPKHVFAAQQG